MANKPVSIKNDPASLAFSAVENALKESILEPEVKSESAPRSKNKKDKHTSRAKADAASRISARTSNVANDDKFSPSRVLYGLNAKPSRTPIWIATVLSLIWAGITGFAAYARFTPQISEGIQLGEIISSIDFAGIIATILLPILGFFAVAILARRAQDLRIAAASMTQAAVRLAEPETTAADKVATVGQAVRREVTALADGLERALSRAGELEVMIHNEVTVLDKTYSENESRMRGLIQELASQRDSVITNSERVREAISDSHSGLVFDLDMIAQRIAGTIEERGKELTTSMNSASENLQQAFGEQSESFISLVDNRTTDLLASLDDSAGRLNLTLEDRTSNISTAFEERTHELASVIDLRMSGITEALDTRAVSLNEAIEERTASISTVLRDGGSKILTDLRDRGHEVGGALDAIGLRIANEISGRASEAEVTMTHLTSQMDEMVSTQLNSMESRMQSAILEISGTVDDASEQAKSTLLEAGNHTLSQMDTRIKEVGVVIDTRLKSFDEIIGEKGDRLSTALDSYTTSFSSRANVLELALDEKTGHFNDQISQRTREMAETLTERSLILSNSFELGNAAISDTLETGQVELRSTLEGTSDNFSATFVSRTQDLSNMLEDSTNKISTSIGTRTHELAETIERHGTEARDKIDASLQNVTTTMDMRSSDLTSLITEKVAQVNESLGRGIENAVERISDAESGISARVEAAAATVNHSAALTADLIEAGVNSARTAITDMVDKRLGTLPKAITAQADVTADRLSALNETLNETMGKTVTDMQTNASLVESVINTTMDQTVANLESSATRIEEKINSRIVQAAEGMSADVGQSADRMDSSVRAALKKISEVAERFESLVRIDAAQTAASLGQQVEQINTSLEEKTGQFATLIDQKSAELASSLGNHSNILNEALHANATEAQNIMTATSSSMITQVSGALEKLNESNSLLQTVLDASTTNLATLENSVASQTSIYSNTVRDALVSTEQAGQMVSEHVGALQTTIHTMMEEFGAIVGKLDSETANIDHAARNLSSASNASLDAVESRREAMDTLALGFTARADEIDNRLRNFAQSISDTVNQTESRLTIARATMDEALNSTTDVVTERLESLAQTASAEGVRTGSALQSTQETMLAEMQQAMTDATQRFNETAQAMQETARQVGSELESTRTELQRGFLELPKETKVSAAAMRSVVAEQIEALNELNSIVRAQPTSHDVSRASIAPAPVAPARPATPLTPPAPSNYQPSNNLPNMDGTGITNTLTRPAISQTPTAPANTTPAAPAKSIQQANKAQSNGWLQDVLRNASSANQQANVTPHSNTLSTLSDEIARSIDENALADAWQRYQIGESGAFSRRIYTLTGQGTYDEIRKKLQRDPEFAETTRQYVAEFEQLLQTANNTAEARQILTSDRGKVFAMLAHASGKIG